ncbi:MAG: D-TA family PLP-dependent enzyme [Planctomycetaceae bacterium]
MLTPYSISSPDKLLSPSLIVFRDLVARNIDRMIEVAGGVSRLRPHCKTHKMTEVVRLQLDRGITRQKAATLAEAEMLARAGCRDIVLSYNLVGPNIARAVTFCRTFPDVHFAALADDSGLVNQLGTALQSAGVTMELLVDINPGRDRTGLRAGPDAERLYQQIAATPGLRPGGLHIYDGQHNQSDLTERTAAVAREWEAIAALRDRLRTAGLTVPRLICGGTPTFPVYAHMTDPDIELSPGTCLFHDASYAEKFPDLTGFAPAALVFTRVISRPTATRLTLDCGTKSVASDPPTGQRVVLPAIPEAVQLLHNEEHLVVEVPESVASRWSVGDWTLAIPRHICPTSALHREAVVIAGGEITAVWPVIARDRMLTV